ncbi:MAG TPA: mucoidy inhibitor MuiA family protein [Xanthobacteraceae bacterium]|nr:mucoidy inhibitor MuiA family protein [Xanthobacteraceae bacterium]
MKSLLIAGTLLAGVISADAAEVDITSKIDSVIVYPDGATITRIIRVDLPRGDATLIGRDFPLTLDPSSLRVEGEFAGRLVIGSIDARTPKPEPASSTPELEKKIEALKDERAVLDDKIAADTARKNFAERFANSVPLGLGEKGDARPIADWRTAFAAVSEELTAVNAAIRASKLKQRDIDRELARLQSDARSNPPRKMEVRVDLSADAPGSAVLRVSYSVRGARWLPLYDARLDTGTKDRKPALELVRRAEIVQQTGEDWTDVALTVSTVRTAKGGNAPELRPLIVRLTEPAAAKTDLDRSISQYQRNLAAPLAPPKATAPASGGLRDTAPAEEREATVESGGFQVVFRIGGRVSVGASEGAKSFRVASANLAPDLMVRATPALDDTAYLEASFKQVEDAPLLPGRVSLYRDGIFVGRGAMALTPKDETVRLGFGADEKVKVTRAMVRRNESTTGIITSSKIDEREFKITVRNGHDMPIKVTVEDQLPVSETSDIVVEMLPLTTPPTQKDTQDRRGVLAWAFDAQSGEVKDIKLGWRLHWPAAKTVFFDARR